MHPFASCHPYFRCSEWESELTKLVVRFRFDHFTSRYPTNGTEFLRTDCHQTNYGLHEPMSGAIRHFNEVIGLFDFGLTRDQFLNRLRLILKTYPTLHRFSESIVQCALPCFCALSFSSVNMLSGRF
jgi:hypothetical protein